MANQASSIEGYLLRIRKYLAEPDPLNSFWTDDFLIDMFTASYRRRALELVMAVEGYFNINTTITLVSGTTNYAWPTGMEILLKMEYVSPSAASIRVPLIRDDRDNEKLDEDAGKLGEDYNPSFRPVANGFELEPPPSESGGTLRLEYYVTRDRPIPTAFLFNLANLGTMFITSSVDGAFNYFVPSNTYTLTTLAAEMETRINAAATLSAYTVMADVAAGTVTIALVTAGDFTVDANISGTLDIILNFDTTSPTAKVQVSGVGNPALDADFPVTYDELLVMDTVIGAMEQENMLEGGQGSGLERRKAEWEINFRLIVMNRVVPTREKYVDMRPRQFNQDSTGGR